MQNSISDKKKLSSRAFKQPLIFEWARGRKENTTTTTKKRWNMRVVFFLSLFIKMNSDEKANSGILFSHSISLSLPLGCVDGCYWCCCCYAVTAQTHLYILYRGWRANTKKWNYDDHAGQKRKRNYKFTGNAHTWIELGIVYWFTLCFYEWESAHQKNITLVHTHTKEHTHTHTLNEKKYDWNK